MNLHLNVDLGDGTPDDELDLATRDLGRELLEAGVASADLVPATLPAGAKGATGTIVGDLAIAVLPTLLPKILDLLKEWRSRSQGRAIKIHTEVNGSPLDIVMDGRADIGAVGQLLSQLRQQPSSKQQAL